MNSAEKILIAPDRYHAAIFDMDGVVTKTSELHARAWKQLFDQYLRRRPEPFVPFDLEKDYGRYVDGKARIDGIASFLHSRGIALPRGSSDDPPGAETLESLAELKNNYFLQAVQEEGVQPYPSTVKLIQELKKKGIKVALISASRNCRELLASAGLLDLFEVRVDGLYCEKYHIPGKPAPDIFIEAARLLGEEPAHCIVVEDALAGVAAGRAGGFALVIGVDRIGQRQELLDEGADLVVEDLEEVAVADEGEKPNALASIGTIKERAEGRQLLLFLDYDGTLTPIASTPGEANLSEKVRALLAEMAEKMPVIILSGRGLDDIRRKVGVESLYYGGSHGFEIAGPGGLHYENEEAASALPLLDLVGAELEGQLSSIAGVVIERKRFAVALHYRLVSPEEVPRVLSAAEELYHQHIGQLRKTTGKMAVELQPKVHWNKGCALRWLVELLKNEGAEPLPFYIGDDKTDEDGFKAIRSNGIGIAVHDERQPTAASYTLRDVGQVVLFLEELKA